MRRAWDTAPENRVIDQLRQKWWRWGPIKMDPGFCTMHGVVEKLSGKNAWSWWIFWQHRGIHAKPCHSEADYFAKCPS